MTQKTLQEMNESELAELRIKLDQEMQEIKEAKLQIQREIDERRASKKVTRKGKKVGK